MVRHKAWIDFYASLDAIKTSMEDHILRGLAPQDGIDPTPAARACYGLLMNIMAIPTRMQQEREKAEDMLGVYEAGVDTPPDQV